VIIGILSSKLNGMRQVNIKEMMQGSFLLLSLTETLFCRISPRSRRKVYMRNHASAIAIEYGRCIYGALDGYFNGPIETLLAGAVVPLNTVKGARKSSGVSLAGCCGPCAPLVC